MAVIVTKLCLPGLRGAPHALGRSPRVGAQRRCPSETLGRLRGARSVGPNSVASLPRTGADSRCARPVSASLPRQRLRAPTRGDRPNAGGAPRSAGGAARPAARAETRSARACRSGNAGSVRDDNASAVRSSGCADLTVPAGTAIEIASAEAAVARTGTVAASIGTVAATTAVLPANATTVLAMVWAARPGCACAQPRSAAAPAARAARAVHHFRGDCPSGARAASAASFAAPAGAASITGHPREAGASTEAPWAGGPRLCLRRPGYAPPHRRCVRRHGELK